MEVPRDTECSGLAVVRDRECLGNGNTEGHGVLEEWGARLSGCSGNCAPYLQARSPHACIFAIKKRDFFQFKRAVRAAAEALAVADGDR